MRRRDEPNASLDTGSDSPQPGAAEEKTVDTLAVIYCATMRVK